MTTYYDFFSRVDLLLYVISNSGNIVCEFSGGDGSTYGEHGDDYTWVTEGFENTDYLGVNRGAVSGAVEKF